MQAWLRVLSDGSKGSGSAGPGNIIKPSGIVSTNSQKLLVSEIFGSHEKDTLCEFSLIRYHLSVIQTPAPFLPEAGGDERE